VVELPAASKPAGCIFPVFPIFLILYIYKTTWNEGIVRARGILQENDLTAPRSQGWEEEAGTRKEGRVFSLKKKRVTWETHRETQPGFTYFYRTFPTLRHFLHTEWRGECGEGDREK